MAAFLKEKEGVEVFVASMLVCAREKLPFEEAKVALQQIADTAPEVVQRIVRANGRKWLRGEGENCKHENTDAASVISVSQI